VYKVQKQPLKKNQTHRTKPNGPSYLFNFFFHALHDHVCTSWFYDMGLGRYVVVIVSLTF